MYRCPEEIERMEIHCSVSNEVANEVIEIGFRICGGYGKVYKLGALFETRKLSDLKSLRISINLGIENIVWKEALNDSDKQRILLD